MKNVIEITEYIRSKVAQILEDKISGGIYPIGCRPFNSLLEDVVVAVSTADAEQVQHGRAKINIFVKDIDNGSGHSVPDLQRLAELAKADKQILEALNSNTNYLFKLSQATSVIPETDNGQHFANIAVSFKLVTF